MGVHVTRSDSGAAASAELACHDPATGELLGYMPNLDRQGVEACVSRAREASVRWGASTFAQRRALLRAVLQHILEHADALCDVVVRDAGKTRENAMLGEIWPICEKLRWTIAHGERYLRPERVSSGMLLHKRARIEYQPLGVIGVICPWNFPLQNVLGPTIAALMAGNAVVAKVSEWTSWSATRIQQVFDDALGRLGLPSALVQVITGDGATGEALINAGIDKVVFTGSMATGRKVLDAAARTLTPLVLELGGKDPMIVCDDAALSQAVHAALAGTMICSGQMCLAAERIYVFEAIHDRFVDAVVEHVRGLRQGASRVPADVDVGAITMPQQLEIIQQLVDDAVAKGARLHCGGKAITCEGTSFFEPTVLTGVDHSMRLMREETFGPVIAIMRVRDEEQAIALANDTAYGLGSTVFTRSGRRAERIAERIVAGSTCVNDYGLAYMAQELPFGGVRGSGFGRLNGRDGLRACCNAKSVLVDRLPVHRPIKLYPVRPGDYERARATIRLIYTRGLADRAKALVELGRGALVALRRDE